MDKIDNSCPEVQLDSVLEAIKISRRLQAVAAGHLWEKIDALQARVRRLEEQVRQLQEERAGEIADEIRSAA